MGIINRRLERLEEEFAIPPEDEREWQAVREFVRRLTDEELDWLSEPSEEAQDLVPCPHVESITCDCRGDGREIRGFEASPELRREAERRWQALCERQSEIMAREPYDRSAAWRERSQKSHEEQRASAERNRRIQTYG